MIRVSELFPFDRYRTLYYFLRIILFITDIFLMQLNLFYIEYMSELYIINRNVLRRKNEASVSVQHNYLEFMDASACRGLESLAKINEKHNLQ